jgi:hypothetical protein
LGAHRGELRHVERRDEVGRGVSAMGAAVANCKTTVTCASLGFLSLVCAESGEVEVVHRERAEVVELAAVEVMGEEVTGVELVRAAPSQRQRLLKRMTGVVRIGKLGARDTGPHQSLGHTNRWAAHMRCYGFV